jgi:hypothetical protein
MTIFTAKQLMTTHAFRKQPYPLESVTYSNEA